MGQEDRSQELLQLSKLVGWIDEQRKQDKELILRMGQQIEKIGAESRESAAQMVDIDDRLRQSQSALARVNVVDGALRQVREELTYAQRRLQELEQRGTRDASVQQAEVTRLANSLTDLTQHLTELKRRDDEQHAKLQLFAEEIKHDRAGIAPLPGRFEHVEKLQAGLAGRVHLLDEQRKREETQLSGFQQADEDLRTEQRKLWQWQQSAEVRWARQLADWATQMAQWQRLFEDHGKIVHDLVKHSEQARNTLELLQKGQDEQHERLSVQNGDIREVVSTLQVANEEINRARLDNEAQRRRLEEITGITRQIEDSLQQEHSDLLGLTRRFDHERTRVDELMTELREKEQEQQNDRSEIEALQGEARALRFDLQDDLTRLQQDLADVRQKQQDSVVDLVDLQERHYRRQIEDLEQHVCELKEISETGLKSEVTE